MRQEQIDALMSELGPVLDPLGIAAFPSSKCWGIALDDETSIVIDLDEAQGKLVLSCEIGLPPAGDRSKLYELMLRHNFHWDRTGGIRLAVDGAGGNVVQLFDLPTDRLDVPRLSRTVRRFAEAARAWREIVGKPSAAGERASSDEVGFPMIRA